MKRDALVLKWAWRHYALYVDECESLDDAVARAGYAADYGLESIAFVEVWDADGYRLIPGDDVLHMADAREQPAVTVTSMPEVAEIALRSPTGECTAQYGFYTDEAKALADIERLRGLLGERVIVTRPGSD